MSSSSTPQFTSDLGHALSEGKLHPEGQQQLAHEIHGFNESLANIPTGFVFPSPLHQGAEMDVDVEVGGSSGSGSKNTDKGLRLQVVSKTKQMKTFARNKLQQLERLNKKLVTLGAADNLEKRKKFFQFRLVDVDHIRAATKLQMDTDIADATVNGLTNDLNWEIDDVKTKISRCADELKRELEELRDHALSLSSLTELEKLKLASWWNDNIKFNIENFNNSLIIMKTNPSKKVFSRNTIDISLEKLVIETIDEAIVNCELLINLFLTEHYQFEVGPEGEIQGHYQHNYQIEYSPGPTSPKQKKTRSILRKQRRKTQKAQRGPHPTKIDSKTSPSSSSIPTKGKQKEQVEEKQGQPTRRLPTNVQNGRKQKGKKQKVFVNNTTDVLIPSYVYRMLNLGANYQLASMPTQESITNEWEIVRAQILKENNGGVVNNFIRNAAEAVNDHVINNKNFINKVTSDRRFAAIVKHNKLIGDVYKFIVQNNLLVILADKNLGLTIVDQKWYISNMRKHFHRKELFELLDLLTAGRPELPDLGEFTLSLQTCCMSMDISSGAQAYLVSEYVAHEPRVIPLAYGLIKLHKQPHKLRIITPVVNWVNCKAARFIAAYLQKYVENLKQVLPNSLKIIKLLEAGATDWPMYVSFDICDMYNSVDQDECISGITWLAKNKGWWTSSNDLGWKKIIALTKWVFKSSWVTFDNKIYLQKRGLPMGSSLSPPLANLYLASLEVKSLSLFSLNGMLYGRYLDDIIIMSIDNQYIEPGTDNKQHPAYRRAINYLDTIKVHSGNSPIEFEETGLACLPGESIEFLDLKVTIENEIEDVLNDDLDVVRWVRPITVEVFDKPTNLHIYTDPSTFYPMKYVYNWIQGENIRYIRNSSNEMVYKKTLEKFKEFLLRRNYLEKQIQRFVALNQYEDRNELLEGLKPHDNRKEKRKGKTDNRYIMLRNIGTRNLMTHAVRIISANDIDPDSAQLIPVVTRGKSITTVLNKARKIISEK